MGARRMESVQLILMFPELSLLACSALQSALPRMPPGLAQVAVAVELIARVAGSEDLSHAADRSQEDVDGLLKRSEVALNQFKDFAPEIQELAEMEFVQRCEDKAFEFDRYDLRPRPVKDEAYAHLDQGIEGDYGEPLLAGKRQEFPLYLSEK
jgi:hypothetical protein